MYPICNTRTIVAWFFVLVLFTGCERDGNNDEPFDCANCYQEKPEFGPLEITVTINSHIQYVPIAVYEGKLEDSAIVFADTARYEDYVVDVPVNKYYTVAAKYLDGNINVFAVDGIELKLKHTDDDCDKPCYYFTSRKVDVRLQ